MVFSNIFLPFSTVVIVKNGFKGGNDRLVAGNTIKCIGELVVRGEERMKLPRPGERKTSYICLGISEFIKGIAIVVFHPDDGNRSGMGGEDGM